MMPVTDEANIERPREQARRRMKVNTRDFYKFANALKKLDCMAGAGCTVLLWGFFSFGGITSTQLKGIHLSTLERAYRKGLGQGRTF